MILWHARYQTKDYRNVMKSPDYLFTSPQISQALLHGIDITGYDPDRYVELTRLRVKKPLVLVKFETSKEQIEYANMLGLKMKAFGLDDIKLIEKICEKLPHIDGYRAFWDQDQVTLCARAMREKLEVTGRYKFDVQRLSVQPEEITFVTSKESNLAYYIPKYKEKSRRLIKQIKRSEKNQAIVAKKIRTLGKIPPAPTGTFKRPALRKKKPVSNK
jgi:hypothetical protein